MEFRILGPLEVVDGGQPLDLGGQQQRALLAMLLLEANRVVASARLIDALWEDDPPETADKALQVYVSRLRKLLGRERVETQAPGYLLKVGDGELDLMRFRDLVDEGKPREALSLWRGPALADFAHRQFAQSDVARLEELRMTCLEARIEDDLAQGRHAELVGELESMVKEHPLRERLRRQLMLALYRCGRHAEALEAYQDARRALVEELGLEPSKALQELERAILVQDPSLDFPSGSAAAEAPSGASLAAREAELDRLLATLDDALARRGGEVPAPARGPSGEVRKTVTVLFCDLTGSTSIGEQQDPELLREVMSRYYDRARVVLERHGGTVEKFIGDAVMAVFGIPVLHEDDALRAARSAVDLREAIASLNEELEHAFGVRIEVRIGVNTGQVIAGDPGHGHSFVAGDAVNVAQRLEAAAPPGEILIGGETYGLAKDAIDVEPVEPLELKGKRDRVAAYRLLGVKPGAPAHQRRLDSPMVGREHERDLLSNAFERAASERACHLVTVIGPAGIGKSRLVTEALQDVGDRATVLSGSCLPYGEGITFWPVLEVVKQATGIRDDDSPEQGRKKILATLQGDDSAELAAGRVAELIGLVDGGAAVEEGFWGVRRLLEAVGRRRPLVVVFDDANWAEPTLLDLIEYVADWSRDAPLLLVCMARQDLLDVRPSWGAGKPNATTIALEPLSRAESDVLIENLLGRAALEPDVSVRIREAAEGNPLFVEEMLEMLIDGGLLTRENGRWRPAGDLSHVPVPPTIQALLASRLDQLDPFERHVIERAAVEGKTFHRGSVRALADGEARDRVGTCLLALGRKGLVRPHTASFAGEDAFRFRHVLIREAAYDSLPKQVRAELHERFAAWLEEAAGDRVAEYEELLGYHLEQVFRYRSELARVDDRAKAAAVRGGTRLSSAGRRALARGDFPAAVSLLHRASALLEESGAQQLEVLLDLGAALGESGKLAEADSVLVGAIEAAERADDHVLAERGRIEQAALRLFREPEFDTEEALDLARAAIATFEEAGDELGIAKAWTLVGDVHWARCRLADMADVLEQALVHAERAGEQREISEILAGRCRAALLGPTRVEDAIALCNDTLTRAGDDLKLQARIRCALAWLHATRAEFAEARTLLESAQQTLDELGLGLRRSSAMYAAVVELLAGEPAAAERELRRDYEELERMGEKSQLSTTAALLARSLCEQGRLDEADRFTALSEQAASPEDIASQVWWRGARARVEAGRGNAETADALARQAVALAEDTDWLDLQAGALVDLADVLGAAGRLAELQECLTRAIALYEAKGNVVSADRARARLERLAPA